MKLQLDTSAKTIKVEGSVKLSELTDTLDKILPGIWKEFTLEANTTIVNWQSPVYIYRDQIKPPVYPYWYTCQNDNTLLCSDPNIQQCSGQYNIEITQ